MGTQCRRPRKPLTLEKKACPEGAARGMRRLKTVPRLTPPKPSFPHQVGERGWGVGGNQLELYRIKLETKSEKMVKNSVIGSRGV